MGFRATLIRDDLISDLALNPTCKDPVSKQGPIDRFRGQDIGITSGGFTAPPAYRVRREQTST